MRKETASTSRSVSVSRSPRLRSAVTNGKRLHVIPPGDTRWARRFRDVLGEITGDLGGAEELSEGQRQLARRAATIALECEKLEAKAVAGESIDLDTYGQLTDRLGRAFGRLGLQRRSRDVTLTLEQHIAANYGDRTEEAASESPSPQTTIALQPAVETSLPELPADVEGPPSTGGAMS